MSNPTTHAESAEYWMAKANNLEAKLIEKDKYIGTLEMMCLKYIMMDKEND